MVGLVRRRGWGLLWGVLVQWNIVCRSVTFGDVKASAELTGINRSVCFEETPYLSTGSQHTDAPLVLMVGRFFSGKTSTSPYR